MNESVGLKKKNAKLAGLMYFIFALTAIYSYVYVSAKIILPGDHTATGANILTNEFLYRTSIFANILTTILFVIVVLLLYRLLKDVNSMQAKLMVGFVLVAAPFSFIAESLKIIVLQIYKGNLLKSSSAEQIQDATEVLLKICNYGKQLTTFHWGLWLIPLGLLVYKSGFIPKLIGIFLLINGIGYMISSMTFILFPTLMTSVSKILFPTFFIGEIPLILWLMIKGIKDK